MSAVVYLAGPFRAPTPWQVEHNIRRAEEFFVRLWKAGVTAICVHNMGRFLDKEVSDDIILRGMQRIMLQCQVVVVLEGWEESKGTSAEIDTANRAGIPVLFAGRYDNFDTLIDDIRGV